MGLLALVQCFGPLTHSVKSLTLNETETVVLCVCVTMSQEDMIFSHVFINVYVVSLIIKLFCKF